MQFLGTSFAGFREPIPRLALDGGYWLVAMLIQGAVIGMMGYKSTPG